MSRLTELLRQAYKTDAQLGADLASEISALMKRRNFGLVFERHQPEAVELSQRVPRRGDKVRILPPRGTIKAGDSRLWRIERIERTEEGRVGHLAEIGTDVPETTAVAADDLVVVAEFNDPLFPGLVETGRVERGGDKPFHTVINAENFHALQMLTYTHRGKIDAIYIDPPYNTGAKDWKYNNDYVGDDDAYRHSKWLAMMERRLKIAQELLNPEDSVLIVTIDEKEYLRLGLLLEQTFPEARIQMVSSIINPKGSSRKQAFSRTDEYIFFVKFGNAAPLPTENDMTFREKKPTLKVRWAGLMRQGANGKRTARPKLFYPIFIDNETRQVHSVGEYIPLGTSRESIAPPEGTTAIWPIAKNGQESRWACEPDSLRKLLQKGYVKRGRFTPGSEKCAFEYLQIGTIALIDNGEIVVSGHNDDGSVILEYASAKKKIASTAWHQQSHSASEYGSTFLKDILPGREFPFPKSLYAVEDTLRFFIENKPNATVVDFFAGSGTTAHAVMRLNRQDGGKRQSILITNNEVSAGEQMKLRAKGYRPGDFEWECLGICDYVTKPRITAAITGRSPEGQPINGQYLFTDEFPLAEGFEENAAFFNLTFEGPLSVRHDRAFKRIAPMLWMRAGSQGRVIDDLGDLGWDVSEKYGVLKNLDAATDFVSQMSTSKSIRMAFIVTDDETAFQMVCRDLPAEVEKVRLYESYLQNFMINSGRSL